ncbi:MAG: VWA domain-containing protein [Haloplanus sp.]
MHSDPPDFDAARDRVLREVVRFVRKLRLAGATVPANAALPAVEALVEVGLGDRAHVRAALHATLVTGPRDSETFDEHFPEFWYRLRTGLEATGAVDGGDGGRGAGEDRETGPDVDGSLPDASAADADGLDADDDGSDVEMEVQSRRISDTDVDPGAAPDDDGRSGTFSAVGDSTAVDEERTGGTRLDAGAVRRFEAALATLSGRRWSRSRDGEAVDVRGALRESLATGGVAVTLPAKEHDESAFSATVLVDVSQSVLDAVDRGFLLAVLDALVADGRSVRVFFFDTDIREVTDVFASQRGDPAAALERSEVTWGGGTQIGASLATLRERWPHAVDRQTATVVVSDGLDVGEVDDLEDGMAWLARRSGGVVWLNPLAASPRYEPTCRGMAAALPYVDALFAFGGNDDLAEVARQLGRYGLQGPVGYEHDFRDREAVDS